MKKLLSLMAAVLLAAVSAYSQSPSPGIFNYQGVARNSVGNVLVNKTITLRLTIHDASAGGAVVYQESRTVTTNPFGLFNVQVGSAGASNVSGTIAGVNWGVNAKYIQVEIDPNGGTTFINIGTAQIASVPYALYSSLANDLVLPFNKTQSDNGSLFKITNSGNATGSTALEGITNSTAANANAIIGTVGSGSPGGFSAGIRGINNGTGGLGIGVYGSQAGSGWGVYGTTPSGLGVYGLSSSGIGVYGNATSGTGVFGNSTTGNSGVFSNTNNVNGSSTLLVSSNGTGWAGDFVSTNATTRALRTSGGLQHTGINEANNRILASDAVGNATWKDPSAIGVITGSGTLNYVSKWTPNGTSLGNSQIFDNGTSVGINTNTPNAAYRLEVNGIQRINLTSTQEGGELRFQEGTLFGAPNHWIIDNFESFAGGNKFRIWNDAGSMVFQMMPTGRVAVGNMVFSDQPQSTMDIEGNLAVGATYSGTNAAPTNGMIVEGNVGIGLPAPTAKLHVLNSNAAAQNSLIINQSNATNTANAVAITDVNISNTGYGAAAISAQRGAGSLANTYLYTGIATAITGIAASPSGFGIQGTSETGYGVTGLSTSGISVHGINLGSGNAARFENAISTVNPSPVVYVQNVSTVGSAFGVHSVINPTNPGGFSSAVRAQNNGTGGLGIGVWASQNGSGWGVLGTAPSGLGIYGSTNSGVGVWAEATSTGWGLRATGNTNTAVFATSNSGFGGDFRSQTNYAGLFQTTDPVNNTAALVTVNGSSQQFARALYAQGSGYSGYYYTATQAAEFQSNATAGVVSISTANNAFVGATETGNGIYAQILNTNGFGNAAVLGISSNINSHGLYGIAPAGGIGRALLTNGPVQLTGIGAANNYVLASDASGNATWKPLSGVGGVSGAGTLNYVPKWTPNGFTVGNSQIVDNGFAVGIGTAIPLTYLHTASNVNELYMQDLDDATSISLIAKGAGYTGGVGTRGNDDLPLFTNNLDRVTVKATTGYVGIGNTNPTANLEVFSNSVVGTPQIKVNENDNDFARISMRNTNAVNSGNNFWDIAAYTNNTRSSERFNIYNNATGNLVSITGNGAVGIGNTNPDATLFVNDGKLASTAGYSYPANIATKSRVTSTIGVDNIGINAFANGSATQNHSVFAEVGTSASFNYGLRTDLLNAPATGQSWNLFSWDFVQSPSTRAGVFFGNVDVVGTLSKSAGTFKIDHPQDPANKYLIHSFVESPDMMNVYNGNIVTDANGKAVVSLPSYFQAENMDFKYQLTVLDETQFAMARVSKKIDNNRFEIMTDKPGIEVSWQVTGVRNDAYAQQHRIVPEVEKVGNEKGKYLHPELFGKSIDQKIGPAATPKAELAAVTVDPSSKQSIANSKPVQQDMSNMPKAGMSLEEMQKLAQAKAAADQKTADAKTKESEKAAIPAPKPVMTGDLQKGTVPNSRITGTNSKELDNLNKTQGAEIKPDAVQENSNAKIEKGKDKE